MIDRTRLAQEWENLLGSVLNLAHDFVNGLGSIPESPQHRTAVCLYVRLWELGAACKTLLERQVALVGIPVLHRTIFETEVHLVNVIKHPDYWKRMHKNFLKEKRRVMNEAKSLQSDPLVAENTRGRDVQRDLDEAQGEFERSDAKPINVQKAAELAEMQGNYHIYYRTLCLYTHTSLKSLEEWYIEADPTNGYCLNWSKQGRTDMMRFVEDISKALLSRTISLAQFLQREGVDFVLCSKKVEELNRITHEWVREEEARIRNPEGPLRGSVLGN